MIARWLRGLEFRLRSVALAIFQDRVAIPVLDGMHVTATSIATGASTVANELIRSSRRNIGHLAACIWRTIARTHETACATICAYRLLQAACATGGRATHVRHGIQARGVARITHVESRNTGRARNGDEHTEQPQQRESRT